MRIISLAPSNTEILFALGAGSRIIARTAYCDFPPEARIIPKIGDWINPDISKIKSLKPDIVLTSTIVQEKLADALKADGLTVLHLAPKNLSDVFDSIRKIASAIDLPDESDSLISKMKNDLNVISLHRKSKPRLYIEEWHDPPFVSGNWVPRLASIAGFDFGLIKEGEYSKKVSTEEVSKYDPEFIVLSICGVKLSPEIIKKRKGWSEIKAVKNGNILVFDDSLLNRPGPRLVEGCRLLSTISFS